MPDAEIAFLVARLILAVIFCIWAFYAGVSIRRLPTIARYEAFVLYVMMTVPFVGFAALTKMNWMAALGLLLVCWPTSVRYANRRLKIGVLGRAGYFRLLAKHASGVEVVRSLDDLAHIQVLLITPEELDKLADAEGSQRELYKAVVTNEVNVQLIADYMEHSLGCSNVGKPLRETTASLRRFTMFELAKVITEKTIAIALLILLSPLMLIIALLVLLLDGRPIIYKQRRLGQGGRAFDILKFRTMAESKNKDEDPETTWLGGYLRYFHVDELPQLINIVKGEMAFVGPRPEWILLADEQEAPEDYWLRLAVKPGMTGWAQVNYKPSYTKYMRQRKLGYDVYYINNRTFFMVSLIWMRTIWMLVLALTGNAKGRYLEETRTPRTKTDDA